MIITYLFFLPIIFQIIKIQVSVGFCFLLWFIILFLTINYILNTEYVISCKELPLNTSKLTAYAVINLIILLPKVKAFLIFYNLLEFIKITKNKNNQSYYKLLIIILFVIFILKITIFLVIGYSFYSLLITSDFVIRVFNLLKWNYIDNVAKYQSFLINCLLNNMESIGKAENMNIIIKQNEIIFNMKDKKFLLEFFSKVVNPELLLKAFSDNAKIMETQKIDNHFNFSISSKFDFEKNISKNLTSSNKIKIIGVSGEINEIKCDDCFIPNLMGENKPNYLTPSYELNKSNSLVTRLEINKLFKMQQFSNNASNSIILDANKRMLESNKSCFYENQNAYTVREYTNEYKIGISENIKYLDEFVEKNKKFLELEQNKNDLKSAILIITNIDRDINLNDFSDKIIS